MEIVIELEKYDGTFQKSKNLPFHRWYPYIEGFGEKFVCEIIKAFADKSTYLVDPFAGCGTSLLVASKHGLRSGYCEVNPFLRFVIETKINSPIRLLEKNIDITKSFTEFINHIESNIQNITHCQVSEIFIGKKYFREDILEIITQLKFLIFEYLGYDDDLKNFGLLALAGLLVDVSNLKRAGDLRYRRNNETQKITREDVIRKFKQKIQWIIEDFMQTENPKVFTEFLSEDAVTVKPSRYADLIVTSPPYLNGTNYIRNTKLELWILDFIKNKNDLFDLHHKLISSGINNVTKQKEVDYLPSAIMDIVNNLQNVAYDKRIPLMVHQYFTDMKRFFMNLYSYMLTSGVLFIDIGDSTFCGVYIPVHEFLEILAEYSGFSLEESSLIRYRRSRGGIGGGQYLLKFRKLPNFEIIDSQRLFSLSYKLNQQNNNINNLIDDFQDKLPYREHPYNKRNWGHNYHSLCSYQSKLKPSIAHFLIQWFTKPSDKVLDPFGGVGTIPLEAKILGRSSIMTDISPTAYIVAKAKVESIDRTDVLLSYKSITEFIKENKNSLDISEDLHNYSDFGFNKKLGDYYETETFKEILSARKWLKMRTEGDITKLTSADSFIAGCLLHILHGNRPYSLSRRSHPIIPFAPTGSFEYRSLEKRLWEKYLRTYDDTISNSIIPGNVYYKDARKLSDYLSCERVDAIITSPPFIHSTRFHINNWIRNWFCGWEPHHFNIMKMNFVEVLQEKDINIYHDLLEDWSKILKPKGLVIFHLGTTKDFDMIEEIILRLPKCYSVAGKVYEFVRDSESHGLTSQGITVRHGFLFLERS